MKPKNNIPTGRFGEEKAAQFLLSKGFKIIERNFKKPHGDIDIIALDGQTLAFIEVKTRISSRYGPPEEAIPPWKIRSLIQSAQYYKLLHQDLPDSMRIDLVAVSLT